MGKQVLIDTNILIYVFTSRLSDDLSIKMNRFFKESFIIYAIYLNLLFFVW